MSEGAFERALREIGHVVEENDGFRLYECFVNTTFSKANGGGDGVGPTKAGKGVKIMVLVDAKGLPVAVDTRAASTHESKCVQQLFEFMLTRELPDRVISDKAYDSDQLDADLEQMGIEMIAPHRKNRRPENRTQDGRRLRRYKRRYTVERTISWLQHYRRLCIRLKKSMRMFQGYLHFACILLLLIEVLGWVLHTAKAVRRAEGRPGQTLQRARAGECPAESAAGRCGA